MTEPPRTSSEPVGLAAPASGRVFTVPNLISFVRLLGVPLFLYLFLIAEHDLAALVVLMIGGTSDWVDGYAARALGQVSRLGELLDPMADRLYILATVVAFTIRDLVPWEFTVALLAREVLPLTAIGWLRWHGYGPPPVHYLGKTATFVLLVAFPFLLLSKLGGLATEIGVPAGWSLALWGLVLYWCAGVLYLVHARRVIGRSGRNDGVVG
ncbi:MAG: CDP-alcohol phosphatidyltransferase family protein [Micromonosporaceae bacterium]